MSGQHVLNLISHFGHHSATFKLSLVIFISSNGSYTSGFDYFQNYISRNEHYVNKMKLYQQYLGHSQHSW